jgi:hypothetical protein
MGEFDLILFGSDEFAVTEEGFQFEQAVNHCVDLARCRASSVLSRLRPTAAERFEKLLELTTVPATPVCRLRSASSLAHKIGRLWDSS